MDLSNMLRAYLPEAVACRLGAWRKAGRQARSERIRCAVLVVDISGFTPLAQQMAEQGPVGAEILSTILGDLFGPLVQEVTEHRGDVLRFPGDAAICIWEETPVDDAKAVIALAVAAALGIQRALSERPPTPGEGITARTLVSWGEARLALVGGVADRYEFLVDGEVIHRASRLCGQAPIRQVVIDAETAPLLPPSMLGPVVGPLRIVRHAPVHPPGASPRVAVDSSLVAPFVQRGVRRHLEQQLSGWAAEFRTVSVLFVSLSSLSIAGGAPLDTVNRVFRTLQEVTYRFGGCINQFLADDKGHVGLLIWGLPHAVHEDDPARACIAAVALRDALAADGCACRIGISTGRVFCGLRGGASRVEYAVIGHVVNLGARLMATARSGAILCEATTAREAGAQLHFSTREPIRAKGLSTPVPVFTVESSLRHRTASRRGRLLGREEERHLLEAALRQAEEGHSCVIVIEGEAGIGKSHFLAAALDDAVQQGIEVLRGAAAAVEAATPLYAWRGVFSSLLNAERGPQSLRLELAARLEGSRWQEFTALLRNVLSIDLPESELTSQLSDEGRADATQELMIKLLAERPGCRPLLLVLEDGHWFDSFSWSLADRVRRSLPACVLVLTTRPLVSRTPACERLLRDPQIRFLRLDSLDEPLIAALVRERLGVAHIDPEIVRFVHHRSSGNPFFAEQIAATLRDRGLVVVDQQSGTARRGVVELDAADLPSRVEGLIASRIDFLQPAHQLTLKVASVVGHVFQGEAVSTTHPLPAVRRHVASHLTQIARQEFIQTVQDSAEPLHRFSHVVLQQVAYSMLSYRQRAELHAATARWIETRYRDDLEPYLGLLAHHWVASGDKEQAIPYLERAGQQALLSFANREAILHFERALAFAADDSTIRDHHRSFWHACLAKARLKLADYEGAAREVDRALLFDGVWVPSARWELVLGLACQVAVQVWHRLRRGIPVVASGPKRERLLRDAELFSHRSEYGFFYSDALWTLYGMFTQLNLGERAGSVVQIAMGSAGIAVAAGIAGMHPLARLYARQAISAASSASGSATMAFVHEVLAVYHHGYGAWKEVAFHVRLAIHHFSAAGDGFRREGCLAIEEMLHLHRGDLDPLADVLDRLKVSVFPVGVPQNQAWCAGGLVALDLLHGTANVDHAGVAQDVLQTTLSFAEQIFLHGILASAWLALNHPQRARESALAAASIARQRSPAVYYLALPLLWNAETLWTLFERVPTDGSLRRALGDTAHALRRLARLQTVARPSADLAMAYLDAVAQRKDRAASRARQALNGARRLAMEPVRMAAHRFLAAPRETDDD